VGSPERAETIRAPLTVRGVCFTAGTQGADSRHFQHVLESAHRIVLGADRTVPMHHVAPHQTSSRHVRSAFAVATPVLCAAYTSLHGRSTKQFT